MTLTTTDVQSRPVTVRWPETPVPNSLASVVSVVPASSGTVDLCYIDGTSTADEVPEGHPKHESGLTGSTIVQVSLPTVAHWSQVSRQAWDDGVASSPFQTKMAAQVQGKVNALGLAAIAGATVPSVTDVYEGYAALVDEGYSPNVVFAPPAGMKDLLPALDLGLALIPIVGLASPIVADGLAGIEMHRRGGVSLYVSESHASTFTSNVLTVLAEARAGTFVIDTGALRQAA